MFIRAESIETAEAVKLVLLLANPRESAFLASFRDEWHKDIDVAFNLTRSRVLRRPETALTGRQVAASWMPPAPRMWIWASTANFV